MLYGKRGLRVADKGLEDNFMLGREREDFTEALSQ